MRIRLNRAYSSLPALARNLRDDQKGAVAIQMALISVALLGVTGLATDVGYAYYMHRQMQSAADTAAFSAAVGKLAGFPAAYSTEAYAVAGKAGFVNGANGVTVTVNNPPVNPPASGNYPPNSPAVQVIVQKSPVTLPLIGAVCSILGGCSGTVTVAAQAVASTGFSQICMLALKTTGAAFQLNGNITVGSPGCGLADNSASNPATDFKGGSAIVRGQFTSQGPQNTSGNNASFPDAKPKTGVTVTDPYIANGQNAWVLAQSAQAANLPASSCSTPKCTSGTCSGTSYCSMSGGTISGGGGPYYIRTVTGGTLSNGIYYVDSISGAVTVTNATVVVFSSANFGNSAVKITAPTATSSKGQSGLGLVSPNAITVSFGGNGSLNLAGAIYLPNQGSQVTLAGTAKVPCAQVIAGTISLSGDDQFGNDGTCGLANINAPGSVQLFE